MQDEVSAKRAYITKASKDDKNFHIAQASYMGQVADVEILTPYGLYSTLPVNSHVVLWNLNGNEENRVGFGNTPPSRFKGLAAGEVVVGSPQTASNVKFDQDGQVVVTGKNGTTITIDPSGNISISTQGNFSLNATGDVIINGASIQLNGNSIGVARLGDTVGGGVITSASSTVKTS